MLFFWNFLLCVRYKRNETIMLILFLSHPPSTYGGLKCSKNGIFFNFFEYFCYSFWIFYYELRRNETERQYLFSFFLGLFQPILALNEAILALFNFLQFFWNFQLSVRLGRNQTIIFIFSLSHPLSTDFELKLSHNGIFFIFLIFF